MMPLTLLDNWSIDKHTISTTFTELMAVKNSTPDYGSLPRITENKESCSHCNDEGHVTFFTTTTSNSRYYCSHCDKGRALNRINPFNWQFENVNGFYGTLDGNDKIKKPHKPHRFQT